MQEAHTQAAACEDCEREKTKTLGSSEEQLGKGGRQA